jgi:hypothetical protein
MEKIIEPNRIYNLLEASEVLGVHSQTMMEYCRTSKIKAQKIGAWKILGQSLIDFLSQTDISSRA